MSLINFVYKHVIGSCYEHAIVMVLPVIWFQNDSIRTTFKLVMISSKFSKLNPNWLLLSYIFINNDESIMNNLKTCSPHY